MTLKNPIEEVVKMDASIWEIIKTVVSWLWIPLGIYITYRNNISSKETTWKEKIEERINQTESDSKLHNMQIQVIQSSIEEVKQGVNRLVDRLIK